MFCPRNTVGRGCCLFSKRTFIHLSAIQGRVTAGPTVLRAPGFRVSKGPKFTVKNVVRYICLTNNGNSSSNVTT